MNTRVGACLFAITMIASEALAQPPPQKFVPATVKPSELAVRLELAGRIPTKTNPTSPVAVGGDLLLVDEAGYIYRWNADGTQELFTPKNAPAGVSLAGPEPLLNVAANAAGSKVYLVLVSSRVPRGVPQHRSVRDPDAWYIVYEYDFGPGGLTQAKPLVAMQTRTDGHLGGGLAVLDDGSVLFSAGDNGDSYEDGRAYSQALDSHLAKIVRINTADGSLRIVAYGVRGAQRLVVSGSGNESRLTFVGRCQSQEALVHQRAKRV